MTVRTALLLILMLVAFTAAPFTADAAKGASTATPASKESVEKTLKEATERVQRLPGRRRQGATQALNLMRTQSPELCRLTGMEFAADTMIQSEADAQIAADGEDLTEEIGDVLVDTPEVDEDGNVIGDEGEDPEELAMENPEELPVDIGTFKSLWLNYVDADGDDMTAAGVEKQQLMNVILDWLGTKYRFGGSSRTGIDCSAFTRMLYASTAEIELPRTAATQYDVGQRIKDVAELQFGDLVFFKTRRYARITHVGMYLGDNLFAHASSRYGVTISSLESDYYSRRFEGGSRLTDRDMSQLESAAATVGH